MDNGDGLDEYINNTLAQKFSEWTIDDLQQRFLPCSILLNGLLYANYMTLLSPHPLD